MYKIKLKYFLVLTFLWIVNGLHSQKTDTVKVEKKINKKVIYRAARKAAIMSAVFPGLGQIYNRKYWKAPIIYAGLAGFGYLLVTEQQKYNGYGADLRAENNDPSAVNQIGYTTDQLLDLKTKARKYRDIGIIGCAIFYVVNIVDANVDAHLRTFDVSDDLSLEIKPYNNVYCLNNSVRMQAGISLQLKFKYKPQVSQINPN